MIDCQTTRGWSSGSFGYRAVWHEGREVSAHRLAYCEHHGVSLDSIAGRVVRHRCDNPPCTNGEHLILGSVADNVADRVERDRSARQAADTNGRAVLTWDIVRTMRSSGLSAATLGRRYGCSKATAQKVLNNVSWKEST